MRTGLLPLRAFVRLVAVHHAVRTKPFGRFCREYLGSLRHRADTSPAIDAATVRRAVDVACALYLKPSTCFHRSAVLVSLLRTVGIDAQMVMGIRTEPYQGHAWVEIDGVVVNDEHAVTSQYIPVERF